jgi:hypothetical protein
MGEARGPRIRVYTRRAVPGYRTRAAELVADRPAWAPILCRILPGNQCCSFQTLSWRGADFLFTMLH